MSERWFVEYRLAWIKESVEIFGFINREHIMRKFGISLQQSSVDIAKVLERWPDLMRYNKSTKTYERTTDASFGEEERALRLGLA